jgi:hypothetical protein
VRGTNLDWNQIRHWLLDAPLLSDNFTVIVHFLERVGIANIPGAVKANVAESVDRIGTMNLRVLEFLLGAYSLTGRQKVAGLITREHAQIAWDTILEPGNRSGRLVAAASRVLNLRRRPGELLLFSLLRRVKKALSSNG